METTPLPTQPPVNPPSIPQSPQPKNNSKTLLVLLSLLTVASLVMSVLFYLQNQQLKQTKIITQPVVQPTEVLPQPTTNPTADWTTYKNDKYGFEIKHPKDWRIANSIMEWYKEGTINPRYTPSTEDWVMITNLSTEEEASYLEALKNHEGSGIGTNHVKNADGRAITIIPSTRTVQKIEENMENPIPGWETSNLREIENNSSLTITQFRERVTWEMDRDYELALVPYSGNETVGGEKVTSIELYIERNDGNYEENIFNQILSTFKFLN